MFDEFKDFLTHISPAAFGSAFSIFTSKDEFTKTKLALTFLFGMSVAHYIGYGIVEYYKLLPSSKMASAIVFSVGFIGMQILKEVMANLPNWVSVVFNKTLGGGK